MKLSNFTEWTQKLPALYKSEITAGDHILVKTRNSIYELQALKGNKYMVTGGRFDRDKISPAQVTITGCGLGSTFVKTDLVAACGLRIEFGNRIITSTINRIVVFRAQQLN